MGNTQDHLISSHSSRDSEESAGSETEVILHGDVIDVLREIETGTVQCVVTSPPYWGLRDYGIDNQLGLEETPEEYVDKMVEVLDR